MSLDKVFIGRQPILDRRCRLTAYELLFRDSATARTAAIDDYEKAAARVIVSTFATVGAKTVLGGMDGFLNMPAQIFQDEALEALPPEHVVLEVLETVEPGPAIVSRCRQLREWGYRLALDDYVWKDPRESLLEYVDYVKVDVQDVAKRDLPRLVGKLRRRSVMLLAEKVEDREQYERCRKLGFDLYQGYFFARPTIVSSPTVDPARAVVLHLIQQLTADADVSELSETIKQNVDVGVNLLRLVNSAAMGRSVRVASVSEAIAYLGRKQLRRWLTLLLFAGADADASTSALLQTAAVRGRLMEGIVGLAREVPDRDAEDRAFLVGMLSLVDALLNIPREVLLEEMDLEDEIRDALLGGGGELGDFLAIAEGVEVLDVTSLTKLLDRYGIGVAELRHALLDAYVWVSGLDAQAA
jgi:EAL and modified HD-GYP domain-containing signal transduction protein